MEEKIIITFNMLEQKKTVDIEVPLNITARELVIGLNHAYNLGLDTSDAKVCFLRAENPIALLRGNKLISEYGLHDGSIIYF